MTRLIKTLLLAGTVGLGLLSLGVNPVRADIVPTLTSVTPLGGGLFRWSYDARLNANQNVVSGDLFTIYDFSGLVPGSALEPANWVFSSANTGVTPAGLLPLINVTIPDSGGIPNLTWTYTGSTPIVGGADLGTFSANSTYDQIGTTAFASQGTENSGPTAGSKVDNFGWAATPVAPEPGTMALLGLGIAPLLGGLRRRVRKS